MKCTIEFSDIAGLIIGSTGKSYAQIWYISLLEDIKKFWKENKIINLNH